MRHTHFLREDGLHRERGVRIVPLNNFAKLKTPEFLREDLLKYGEIQMLYLPPRIRGVLVLYLDDNDFSADEVEKEPVGLTPAPLSLREELEPGGG
jgi:hypothetical protein